MLDELECRYSLNRLPRLPGLRPITGHLIHIGYPKTGSTFLQKWFADHPRLGYADWSIAGFKDVFAIAADGAEGSAVAYRVTSFEGFAAPLQSYMFYDPRRPERLVPTRRAQAHVCRTLAELFPGSRILIVTRGFRELVLSVYAELARGGLDCTIATFCTFLGQQIRRGENPFDYDALIAQYGEAFGAANLIVMPYELLSADPSAFLAELETRLGLEPFAASTERVHASFTPHELHWYPRLARWARALPIGELPRRRLIGWHLAAARTNRWRGLIRGLQFVRPAAGVTADMIPQALIGKLSGHAERLRPLSLYAGLEREYLFDGSAAGWNDP